MTKTDTLTVKPADDAEAAYRDLAEQAYKVALTDIDRLSEAGDLPERFKDNRPARAKLAMSLALQGMVGGFIAEQEEGEGTFLHNDSEVRRQAAFVAAVDLAASVVSQLKGNPRVFVRKFGSALNRADDNGGGNLATGIIEAIRKALDGSDDGTIGVGRYTGVNPTFDTSAFPDDPTKVADFLREHGIDPDSEDLRLTNTEIVPGMTIASISVKRGSDVEKQLETLFPVKPSAETAGGQPAGHA